MPDPPIGTICESCNARHLHNGRCGRNHYICDDCWNWAAPNCLRCPLCNAALWVPIRDDNDETESENEDE